jgi:AbrB family looped-hinge helix DNA binding protein
MTYHAKMIAGGKIVIPAELRREFGIKDGDSVVLESREGELTVRTSILLTTSSRSAATIGPTRDGGDRRGGVDVPAA